MLKLYRVAVAQQSVPVCFLPPSSRAADMLPRMSFDSERRNGQHPSRCTPELSCVGEGGYRWLAPG